MEVLHLHTHFHLGGPKRQPSSGTLKRGKMEPQSALAHRLVRKVACQNYFAELGTLDLPPYHLLSFVTMHGQAYLTKEYAIR